MADLLLHREHLLELAEDRSATLLELEAWEAFVSELDDEQISAVEELLEDEAADRQRVRDYFEDYLKMLRSSTQNLIESLRAMAAADRGLQRSVELLVSSIEHPALEEFRGEVDEGNFQGFIDLLQQLSILQLEALKASIDADAKKDGIPDAECSIMRRLITEVQQAKHAYLVKHRKEVESDTQTIENILTIDSLIADLQKVAA